MSEAGVDDGHFGALAKWLDAVKAALKKTDTAVLTVEDGDIPGALTAVVRPDRQGIETSIRLIQWAKPEVALLVLPDDEEASFELYLQGDERVVIFCGPPLPPRMPEIRYRGIDPADRERIEKRLIEVATALMAGDPGWEPQSAVDSPDMLIDAYLTDYGGFDSRTVMAVVIDGTPVRTALRDLQVDRSIEHERAWAADAETIAQILLDGPDGTRLRTASKPIRLQLAQAHLRKLDPQCASRNAADPVANAIGSIAKRPAPSPFIRSSTPPQKSRPL